MSGRYVGKTALITGASSGIGEEFARQLHTEGSKVVLVARRRERLEEIARSLNERRPGSAEVLAADLAAPQANGELAGLPLVLRYAREQRVDLLVNNAGLGSFGCFEEIPTEREQEIIALNIHATTVLAQAVIPQMKQRGEGAIIAVSSIAAFQPLPYMATYAASKAYNFIHSIALREELAAFGVSVLTVCPGPTATEFGGVARVPGKMTGVARDSVQMVVEQSLTALQRNKPFVITGARSKLLYGLMKIAPWAVATKITGSVLRSTLHAVKKG